MNMQLNEFFSSARSDMRVGIVMVNWNQREMTLESLAALHRLNPPKNRIVLVDNGSRDGTCEAVYKAFSDVEILALPENEGFCAANNKGAEILLQDPNIEYIFFVNNDIDLESDCINILTAFMDATPAAGACGPLIFYYEPRDVVWAAGGRIFTDLAWFPPILRNKKWHHKNTPRQVDYVEGCALMIRREVIEKVGKLDERYFLYHEEIDWCLRMKQAGYQVWLVPEAKFYHKVSHTVGCHSPLMIYYTSRNKLLFWWKHGKICDLPKFYAFHLVKLIKIFSSAGSAAAWMALCKGIFDAVRGVFGRGNIGKN